MNAVDAIAAGLATFYVAYVVARTGGPGNVFQRLRARRFVGAVVSCFYCVAFYAGMLVYVLFLVFPPALYVLAAAGAASGFYRYTGGEHT